MSLVRKLPLVAALVAVPALASAMNYTYVEGGFGELEGSADALYLGGAKDLDGRLGVLGQAGFIDFDGGHGNVLRGGLQFHTPVKSARNLDFVGTLELLYSHFDVSIPGPANDWSDSDIGVGASAGLRYAVQDNFLVEGKLAMEDVDPFDYGLGISIDGRYYLDKQLSAAIGLANDTQYDGLWLNLRYDLK